MIFRKLFFLYAPDETGAAASAPASSGTSGESVAAAAPPSAPGGGSAAGGGAATAGATAASPSAAGAGASPAATPAGPSWLESLRTAGMDVGKDEKEALANLQRMHQERQQFEQLRPYAPHINNYLKNATEFQKWQAEQAKQQAEAQKASKNVWDEYWHPPEFNPAWMQQVQKDAQGNLVSVPGSPAEIAMKVQNYLAYRAEQADKFMANPHEYIQPTVQALARQIAEETVQKHFQSQQQQNSTQQFVQQHQQWLFEVDAQTGLPKTHTYFDPNSGQMVTGKVQSEWGKKMAGYAKEIGDYQQAHGFHDPEAILKNAYIAVQRDFAISQIEQGKQQTPVPAAAQAAQTGQAAAAAATPAPTPQEAANQKMLDAKNPPGRAAGGRNGNMKPVEEGVTGKNIERIMAERLKKAGYGK